MSGVGGVEELRIISLNMKIEELENDRKTLLRLLEAHDKVINETFKRDAECPYCKEKHHQMVEQGCFP